MFIRILRSFLPHGRVPLHLKFMYSKLSLQELQNIRIKVHNKHCQVVAGPNCTVDNVLDSQAVLNYVDDLIQKKMKSNIASHKD